MVVGVDVGGTHLSCALVDSGSNEIVVDSMFRGVYNHSQDMPSLLEIWADSINRAIAKLPEGNQLSGIGIAMPGPFDYTNGISKMEHKLVALYDKPLSIELIKYLNLSNDVPIRFSNDATCFAIGEAFKGMGSGKQKIVVITLGTGFGAAFIENKLPVVDRPDVPPEGSLWHLPFKDSIADEYFSTGWFVKRYASLTGNKIAGVKELLRKEPTIIKQLFDEFARNLSDFISPHLEKFNADVLVIGGSISKALPHFIDQLKSHLSNQKIDIVPSTLLEEAAILGSAQLLNDHYWEGISKVLPKL